MHVKVDRVYGMSYGAEEVTLFPFLTFLLLIIIIHLVCTCCVAPPDLLTSLINLLLMTSCYSTGYNIINLIQTHTVVA